MKPQDGTVQLLDSSSTNENKTFMKNLQKDYFHELEDEFLESLDVGDLQFEILFIRFIIVRF